MATRGLYKAVVRNIPAFLSKNEFYMGLNVTLPVNQWYFCHGGSQAPSAVALSTWTHSLSSGTAMNNTGSLSLGSLRNNYAILGASAEYSMAFFGFDNLETMEQFIAQYNNFVVEVDQKRKYSL